MTGHHIIGSGIDLAGASLVEQLEAHTASLHYLNALSDRNLELANSSRGQRFHQLVDDVFAAGVSAGTLTDTQVRMRPEFVRYLSTLEATTYRSRWALINVVDTIEELTEQANLGKKAIVFNDISPMTYMLSWTPTEALTVQIFGKDGADDQADLATEPDFPKEFSDLIAVQIALMLLDEVLLLENAEKFVPFVSSRKESLAVRLKKLERVWDVYRSKASESKTVSRPYDPFEEDFEVVLEEDGGGLWL